jgi:hypothetical protein
MHWNPKNCETCALLSKMWVAARRTLFCWGTQAFWTPKRKGKCVLVVNQLGNMPLRRMWPWRCGFKHYYAKRSTSTKPRRSLEGQHRWSCPCEDVWGRIVPLFLTSALDWGECSASRSSRFIPLERGPGTNCIGDWIGPRAGSMDAVEKILLTLPGVEVWASSL